MIVGSRVARDGRDEWTELPDDPQAIVTGSRGCVQSFLRSVTEGTPVPVTGRDAFASLAACVAADESAAAGRPAVPAPSDF